MGSARELPNRTGFAHLFEHLLFLESENLGRGGLDAMSARIGGSGANGSTSRDLTNYLQTVPNDALEKMIWAEADKLGFFINTVNEAVLEKEKQVVKNEKRQGVDNAPYGHTFYVTHKALYPEGHPYSWQVIGSLEHLQAATLDDVYDFYNTWYVPNNATLVIAGDFDSDQARAWIHHYFDEIPRGQEIERREPMTVTLTETRKLFHEDNFARLPELRYTWPVPQLGHEDTYALEVMTRLLASGKSAPLYQVLVEELELTASPFMFQYSAELAGEIIVGVRAFPGVDLDRVAEGLETAFQRFASDGFSEADLQRVKAGLETEFYGRLSSVLGKTVQLAECSILMGDPGCINTDIRRLLAVNADDVMRVFHRYIMGHHHVATSFVPLGQPELALSGSTRAEVTIEPIVDGADGESFELPPDTPFERTPSRIDRSVEPPYGPAPRIRVPEVAQHTYSNRVRLFTIETHELPLIQFAIRLDGGQLLDDPSRPGTANLAASMLMRGTQQRTAVELEQAMEQLGARVNVRAAQQDISITGNVLVRNLPPLLELVEEMLTQPRWDEREFELVRQSVLSSIAQQQGNPNSIATLEFNRLLYGEGHPFAGSVLGTMESVHALTLEEVREWYASSLSSNLMTIHVTGAVHAEEARERMAGLASAIPDQNLTLPDVPVARSAEGGRVYFYDVPNASQSVVRIGYLALAETDEAFYPASVMNYILGGGGFASRLTQELREGRGYTYGIGSSFSGSTSPGPFAINTSVRSNITLEAVALIREILAEYPATFTARDLENTQSFLLKSGARSFETLGAKLAIAQTMSRYDWPADYITDRRAQVEAMTLDRIQALARTWADPDRMVYLIVGDAATQRDRLNALGLGEVIEL